MHYITMHIIKLILKNTYNYFTAVSLRYQSNVTGKFDKKRNREILI